MNGWLDRMKAIHPSRLEIMKVIHQEALELFTRQNIDYGDAFAKYGIIGVLMQIEDKIQHSASMINDGVITDSKIMITLCELNIYSAKILELLDEYKPLCI